MRLKEFRQYITEAPARIQHAEDLIFWDGSKGALRALTALNNMEKTGYQQTSLKWDGTPAIIFGRNDLGQFIFTDKSGFGAKGYDGQATSPEMLEQMFYARSGGGEKSDSYKAFIAQMKSAYSVFEAAVPTNFKGFFKGDLLYFTQPPIIDGEFRFTPNIVEYAVRVDSPLGQKIAASTAGVVIHRVVQPDGSETPLKNFNVFEGDNLLVVPPAMVLKPAVVDTYNTDNLKSFINNHASALDNMMDHTKLRELKMSDLAQIFYTYTNSKVDTGMENLGDDFQDWLGNSRVSQKKQANIINYLVDHEEAFNAMWKIISSIMRVKDDIISQFDSQGAEVRSSINGEAGGEGYVYAHNDGDIKLVPREFFTRANRAVIRK